MTDMQTWERTILLELQKEFDSICWQHRCKLNSVPLALSDSECFWGQFDPLTRTIFLSRKLVLEKKWPQIKGVLHHEMAHLFVFDKWPQEYLTESPHGPAFKQACKILGVPHYFCKAEVDLSSDTLDWKNPESQDKTNQQTEKILDRVKKLLSLATSTNQHEASAAMKKVQQLYAQYNLEKLENPTSKEDYFQITLSFKKKKINAWQQKIVSLLSEHFFVRVIFLKQFDPASLEHHQAFEIIGHKENVLMAEYVYYFLQQKIEDLLSNKMTSENLSLSALEKKSYRLGLLDGFCQNLNYKSAAAEDACVSKALAKFNSDPLLENYMCLLYPKVASRRTGPQNIQTESYVLGKADGKKIILNKAIHKKNNSPSLFLIK